MKIALFSDVHGHLRLVLQCLRCWQIASGVKLDGALIAGDLGCFPDPARLDNATRKWAARYESEEAGFSTFFVRPHKEVMAYFEPMPGLGDESAVSCPILFVAGNHEDYDYLNSQRHGSPAFGAPSNTFPVDCYESFHCIADGSVAAIEGADGNTLQVAGLWGIEDARDNAPYMMSEKAVNLLRYAVKPFDILLSHDAVFGAFPGMKGSQQIARILRERNPAFHLFGHVHPISFQHEYPLDGSTTTSWILEDLTFGKNRNRLLDHSMAILNWNGQSGTIGLVQNEWILRMGCNSWRDILPNEAP